MVRVNLRERISRPEEGTLRVAYVVLFSAVCATTSAANVATITWGPATDTTGSASVSTTGSVVKAFDSGGSGATVNGVVFAAGGSEGDDIHVALDSASDGPSTPIGSFDEGADLGLLDALLSTGEYVGTIGVLPASIIDTVTLTSLERGRTYQLQLFFMDQRTANCGSCPDRLMTFSSGQDAVTLEADPDNSLAAPFGQFVLGTFTADSTTQTFDVSGGIDFDVYWQQPVSNRQVNAWQLRTVPEPVPALGPAGSFLLATLLGSLGVLATRRQAAPRSTRRCS